MDKNVSIQQCNKFTLVAKIAKYGVIDVCQEKWHMAEIQWIWRIAYMLVKMAGVCDEKMGNQHKSCQKLFFFYFERKYRN